MAADAAENAKEEKVETSAAAPEQIEEADLLKAAQNLESEATGAKPAEEPAPDPSVKPVETGTLSKTVEKDGSETLAKSLEISSTLKEFADLVGEHVDALTKSYAGTLDNQNAAILAICGALEGMQKAIGALSAKVEQYGEKPAAPASAKAPEAKPGEVLAKGQGAGSGDAEQAPEVTRAQVNEALMSLVKSAKKAGDDDAENRWSDALVKFDATSQISDKDLTAAIAEAKRLSS